MINDIDNMLNLHFCKKNKKLDNCKSKGFQRSETIDELVAIIDILMKINPKSWLNGMMRKIINEYKDEEIRNYLKPIDCVENLFSARFIELFGTFLFVRPANRYNFITNTVPVVHVVGEKVGLVLILSLSVNIAVIIYIPRNILESVYPKNSNIDIKNVIQKEIGTKKYIILNIKLLRLIKLKLI